MNHSQEIPSERIRYRDEQLLMARDLYDGQHREDLLRWMHTRNLHETWGIASGLGVAQVDVVGSQIDTGGTAVIVYPGYALDKVGRELLQSESIRIAAPVTQQERDWVLTIYHSDNESCHNQGVPESVGSGYVSRSYDSTLNFGWCPAEDIDEDVNVALAKVTVLDGVIQQRLDWSVRRSARCLLRWGTAEPEQIEWHHDENSEFPVQFPISSYVATISTFGAGFAVTPCYFIQLQPVSPSDVDFVIVSDYVTDATPVDFRYQVDLLAESDYSELLLMLHWVGIEPYAPYTV